MGKGRCYGCCQENCGYGLNKLCTCTCHMTPEERDKAYRMEQLGYYIAARADYLNASGWILQSPASKGAPIWWIDPKSEGDQTVLPEDQAAEEQEARDNDLR